MKDSFDIEYAQGQQQVKFHSDSMKSFFNILLSIVFGVTALLGFLFLIIFAVPICFIGPASGKVIGTDLGSLVGSAEGSFNGFTEGYEKGKEAGLSIQDVEVAVKDTMQNTAQLQVLAASVNLADETKIGNETNPAYASFEILKGDVVFTADLSQAEISTTDGTIHITIPPLKNEIYINEEETMKIAEFQKRVSSGSTMDGFEAYIKGRCQTVKATKESISNYNALQKDAEENAVNQIQLLASEVHLGPYPVEVEIRKAEEKK